MNLQDITVPIHKHITSGQKDYIRYRELPTLPTE